MDSHQLERFLQNKASASEAKAVARYLEESPAALERCLPESEWEQTNSRLWLKEKASRRMLRHIQREVGVHGKSYWNLRITAAAASIVLGLFLIGQLYLNRTPDSTSVAAASDITKGVFAVKVNNSLRSVAFMLEDGSAVELLPGAEVTYPQPFVQGDRRMLYLRGEAVFNVAKDSLRPFTVQAGGLATTALGTSFKVKAPGGGKPVLIQLYTGKVVIKAASEALKQKVKEVYLTPGQQLELDTKNLVGRVSHIVTANKKPERGTSLPTDEEGSMTINGDVIDFSKCPLPEVLDKLSKLYAHDIRYRQADIAKINFTGKISTSDSLERVLKTIAVLNELQLKKGQNSYRIRK
ncbi:FecR domain-containing protein [Pontibacter sp. BT731]|uniref:FecR family protein n=1 Tax=Pontibacter coccineus TaxID=3063328 RepID=UPI0026E13F0D|nr:FecR domain-containing protein [Pontibacter sp. BT731]MDO6390101.1 FecR domain-containing protein [Pontibacter sp. BT731]